MRLYVYVLEAKDLLLKNNTISYAKLQVGASKTKSKTRTLASSGSDPVWNEEFVFRVHDIADQLTVSVYQSGHPDVPYLAGQVRIPVWSLTDQRNHTLPPTWFSLHLNSDSTANHMHHNTCGKVLLTLSLQGRGDDVAIRPFSTTMDSSEAEDPPTNSDRDSCSPRTHKTPQKKKLIKAFTNHLDKLLCKNEETTKSDESSDISSTPSEYEDSISETSIVGSSFEEAINTMLCRGNEQEMPEDLHGGLLVDQNYALPSKDLNTLLFAPESQFQKDLSQVRGIIDMQEGPWTRKMGELMSLTRVVTYTKPPSKLLKAVKATEEQTYVKAYNGEYAVIVAVDTPDVPYGNTFRIEILYKICTSPEFAAAEDSSRLVVSWGIKFHQTTMMKGMIEGGARQGLKENFDLLAAMLAKHAKVLNCPAESMEKDNVLETLHQERVSDWELALDFFWNPTLITSGIVIILLQHVHKMVSYFIDARLQMGSDHGVKAQGDGWVVTVAIIEAVNLAALESSGSSDPFVVLTCSGKTRTSSVQLQTCAPLWNEILEFDAMEEPPSVLDVEVFDFDGPFDQACSLGHAEINFLKHTSSELADFWIPLKGKFAMSLQSKLHLRIFLENNNGVETVKEYLTKMEKEVGKKVRLHLDLRSPHKNSAFQKLFGLPPEEFLIKDYLCYLRRKFLLQGRLFLSARIAGFHGNLFRHRTKFFFLWEDIEDIKVLPPSLASIGSPTLLIVLRKGRGEDAKHGAKSQDPEGRLQFYFQSFASLDVATRTIKALWKARALVPEQKVILNEDQDDDEYQGDARENTEVVNSLDANMIKIYSADLSVDMTSLLEMFDGGILEHKVMAKSGCLEYMTTQWETIKPRVYERRVSYKFSHHVSVFGGEVNCLQVKSPLKDDKGCVLNEVLIFQDIPFSDYFHVHVRYQIGEHDDKEGCKCDVYLGIEWLKSNKFRQRITRNVNDMFACRLKEIFDFVKEEILLAT
ncbi:hypothetical protein V2J09_000572 [Rumex salicifolius]